MLKLKNATAPSIFHFIWVGGPLPQKYLRTLLKIAPVAKKSHFTLNVWLDDDKNFNQSLDQFMGFDDQNKLFLDLTINAKTLGIRLRNINELLSGMEKDNFYQYEYQLSNNFKNFVRREALGFKNLAAVSDLLRYEILRQEGGIYCDTDTDFHIEKNSLFQPVKLSCGIKTTYLAEAENGNDIIAAVPRHPALEYTLKYSIKAYQQIDQRGFDKPSYLDNYLNIVMTSSLSGLVIKNSLDSILTKTLAIKKLEEISLMDLKRYPLLINTYGIFRCCPRMDLTIHTSGPAAFKYGLNKFNEDYRIYELIENFNLRKTSPSTVEIPSSQQIVENNIKNRVKNFQLDPIAESESGKPSTYIKLGNVRLGSNSDQTWMPKQNQKLNSFDDQHISSKPFFWKPAKPEKQSMSALPTNLKPNL